MGDIRGISPDERTTPPGHSPRGRSLSFPLLSRDNSTRREQLTSPAVARISRSSKIQMRRQLDPDDSDSDRVPYLHVEQANERLENEKEVLVVQLKRAHEKIRTQGVELHEVEAALHDANAEVERLSPARFDLLKLLAKEEDLIRNCHLILLDVKATIHVHKQSPSASPTTNITPASRTARHTMLTDCYTLLLDLQDYLDTTKAVQTQTPPVSTLSTLSLESALLRHEKVIVDTTAQVAASDCDWHSTVNGNFGAVAHILQSMSSSLGDIFAAIDRRGNESAENEQDNQQQRTIAQLEMQEKLRRQDSKIQQLLQTLEHHQRRIELQEGVIKQLA